MCCHQLVNRHIGHSNTHIETPPSNSRGENSVRTMKEMTQCQKKSVNTLEIKITIMHPFFALLARHSEWLLDHLVRSDLHVEAGARVVKTLPYQSHTANPAPVATDEDDDRQLRFQQAWFFVVAGGVEAIATSKNLASCSQELRPDTSETIR